MADPEDDDLDEDYGGAFQFTPEELAALQAFMGNGDGADYGPDRPINTPDELVNDWLVRYNLLTMRRKQLEAALANETDSYRADTYLTQLKQITAEMNSLSAGIYASRPKATTPTTISRGDSVYEYLPGDMKTPGRVRQIASFPTAPSAASLETARHNTWLEDVQYPEETRQWNQTYGLNTQKEANQVAQWRAQNEQARQNLASELGNWWSRDRLAANQWALTPAWNGVPPGFEANGAYGKLLQMGGVQPRSVQLSTINFDPIEAWRAAQQQVGVK